ncbi:Zn-ribbon domain-containing OB-fold protein [Candidatus Micrarchaeota archaeon]|nr:Zn-ribbon domain-containing OB-fold protein [Candidatus Micrarchaeota archaeon]MBU1930117.1 Zn-ribbon domain-containing OB-fold protein [Candidatus Micrarchaeota archaeon]
MADNAIAIHWRRYPERYLLRGCHCETCKTDFFPGRLFCPNCRRKGKMVSKEMPRTGKIVSFTEVFVGPIGFQHETPYFLALIDLGNKCMILSQIVDSPKEKIKTGAQVKKVFRKIQDTDHEGAIAYGYKFKVS